MGRVGTKPGTRTNDQIGIKIIITQCLSTHEIIYINIRESPNINCQYASILARQDPKTLTQGGRQKPQRLGRCAKKFDRSVKDKDTKSCNNSGARQSSNRSKKGADLIMRIYEGVKVMYDNSLG